METEELETNDSETQTKLTAGEIATVAIIGASVLWAGYGLGKLVIDWTEAGINQYKEHKAKKSQKTK